MEIGTCYLWDHRKELADLVDVWEAANRDDLFSVTSLALPICRKQRLPQGEAPVFVEDAIALGQNMARHQSRAQGQRERRHHALPKRALLLGSTTVD